MEFSICGLIFGLSWAIVSAQNSLEDLKFLKICRRNDPDLNKCVMSSVEKLRPYLKNGIPELNIPPCEPLWIPIMEINQGAGSITLNANYTEIQLFGATKFVLKNIGIDMVNDVIKLRLNFPRLEMISNYNMDGKILILPVTGRGRASGNYSDIDAFVEIRGERYKDVITREEYFRATETTVNLEVGHAEIRLEKMFNGDETLTETMNTFMNDHWKSVVSEIKPALEESIANLIMDFSNKVYSNYPLDVLLPW